MKSQGPQEIRKRDEVKILTANHALQTVYMNLKQDPRNGFKESNVS